MTDGAETLAGRWMASHIADGAQIVCDDIVCCSLGPCKLPAVTMVVVLNRDVLFVRRGVSYEDDAALVFDVQSYLWCKSAQYPVPANLQWAWDVFYRRYRPLVRRSVREHCRRAASELELDDFSQEIWREVVVALPKLAYDSDRGGFASWLFGLARRKIRRLKHARPTIPPHSQATDDSGTPLCSRHLGPEDVCSLRDMVRELNAALDELRVETSSQTYEVFHRRFVDAQSAREVAASLGLTPEAVHKRYSRAMQRWRELTRDRALPAELRDEYC